MYILLLNLNNKDLSMSS